MNTEATYNYPLERCDIADKDRLREYRAKRSEWLYMMSGDPRHAVWTQITSMLWNDAVFRVVNEARRLSAEGKRRSSALNSPLARFIDQGFVATQTLSIRKLMEPRAQKAAYQVVSLRRVVDDINNHRTLITRELYVAHDGLPYDPDPARQRYYNHIVANHKNGVWCGGWPTGGPEAFDAAEMAHKSFDKLSGTRPDQRRRDDLIASVVFERLQTTFVESDWKDIAAFGNKFIAHAADAHSRGLLQDGQQGFSLNRLSHCHAALCQVASAIYGPILWEGGYGLFPVPQFDQFEQLDAAWADSDDLEQLTALWDAHIERVEGWSATEFLWAGRNESA